MLPVLGFIKYFAKFQKLGLKASNLPALFLEGLPAIFLEGLPAIFLEGSLSRFSGINAQYFMNLFPKAAKIARKQLFTSLSILIAVKKYQVSALCKATVVQLYMIFSCYLSDLLFEELPSFKVKHRR